MSTALKTGEATTGSLWNKNSWHWEEKDYNKVAKSALTELLEDLSIPLPDGSSVKIHDVVPTGFASISVRKGKRVVVFEFAISMNYSGACSRGTIRIPEFSNDELDPIFRIDETLGDSKEYLRKSKVLKARLLEFIEFINSADSTDMNLDKQRREDEALRAKAAQLEKGEEKTNIAKSVAEKELSNRANVNVCESSVWNVNSYHWEIRKLDKWAIDWITNKLHEFAATNIDISGECENSIRKGKKISIFNLLIKGVYLNAPFTINYETDETKITCSDQTVKAKLAEKLDERVFSKFLSELNAQ